MPDNLRYVPFSELADVNPSTGRSGLSPDSLVSFIPMADVSNEGEWINRQERRLCEVEEGYTAFQENDVLFAKITPCTENGKGVHAIGLTNGIGSGSTEFHVLRPKHPDSGRFLFYWSQSDRLRVRAASVMTGSAGQQRVPARFFDEFEIPLLSLPEQCRIAEILDAADEAIRQTERLIAKLKAVKAGLLHDLLTRGLDEHGHLRDPQAHPEQFKDSPLGRIPKDWEVRPLADAAANQPNSFVDGPFGSNLKASEYSDEGVRLIQLQNIGEGIWYDENEKFIPEGKFQELIRHATYPGDIAIAKMADPVARACIVPPVSERFVVVADCIKLSPDLSRYDSRYLVAAINHCNFRLQAEGKSTGTTRKRINLTALKTIMLPVPPIEEQRYIAVFLDAHDARIRIEEAELAKLRQVKRGLMDDLLTGRVRVT